MHIREDLVYNKFTGMQYTSMYVCMYMYVFMFTSMLNTLLLLKQCMLIQPIAGEFIGFTHLGDINTHIANFEAELKSGTVPTKPLAKSIACIYGTRPQQWSTIPVCAIPM